MSGPDPSVLYRGPTQFDGNGNLVGVNPTTGSLQPLYIASNDDGSFAGYAFDPNHGAGSSAPSGGTVQQGTTKIPWYDKGIIALAHAFPAIFMGGAALSSAGAGGGLSSLFGGEAAGATTAGGGLYDLGGGLGVDAYGNTVGATSLADFSGGASGLTGAVGNDSALSGFGDDTFTSAPPPDETGAFDMGGSQGVFDSSGNPLYTGPSALDYLKDADWGQIAKQYGPQAVTLLRSLARAAPGVAGAVASAQQSSDLRDLAQKYLDMGAPSRARYESSFNPGFSIASDPGYKDALDQVTKATLHGLSVTGNPADNPNAWMQTLSDVNAKFAYPALQDYRRLNAGTGGLAALTSSAPATDTAAVNAQGGIYGGLGAAAADVFTPKQSLADLLKSLRVS